MFQKSYGKPFDTHFQQRYASTVLELDRLNKDLNEYLIGIQQYYDEVKYLIDILCSGKAILAYNGTMMT